MRKAKARAIAISASRVYDLLAIQDDIIPEASALEAAKHTVRFGLYATLAAIAVFIVGGALAPLSSAVVMRGAITPSSYKKAVQHLEGGIISAILVKDGDEVKEGQPLMRLNPTDAVAGSEGLKASLKATQAQLAYVDEQLVTEKSLVEQGLSTRPRLLSLEGQEAGLQGKIGELRAEVSKNDDILDRTVITAPISGIVNDLQYHTVGGVIPPGGTLMYVVPKNNAVLVDTQIQPRDISRVHIGQQAQISFPTYRSDAVPMIPGKVVQVSADRVVPPAGSNAMLAEGYYLARVEINRADLNKLSTPVTLTPGMPVEVMALGDRHSLLGYYLKPFLDSFRRAFREP